MDQRFRAWPRWLAFLRGARLFCAPAEQQVIVPDPAVEFVRPDLSDLDEAERAEWARFTQLFESGAAQQVAQEPHLSRFTALREKVKWVPADEPNGDPTAA